MTWIHNVYFHSWHFIFQQIQLTNWFGNIVAGIVGYLAGRKTYSKFMSKVHKEGNAELHEKIDHIIKHSKDVPDFKKKS